MLADKRDHEPAEEARQHPALTAGRAGVFAQRQGRRRPFERVLVANRGEIAVRIIRACRELGIESVAVYSDADADAAHVRTGRRGGAPRAGAGGRELPARRRDHRGGASDRRRRHPPGLRLPLRASRLRARPSRRRASSSSGRRARRSTASATSWRRGGARPPAGVAVVPGTLRAAPRGSPDAIDGDRRRGRGGSATRCWSRPPPAAAVGACAAWTRPPSCPRRWPRDRPRRVPRSAMARSTWSARSQPARHVEVQLLGDATGTIVALGERDCSIQRRHQKLVEESPAPGLTRSERRELHALAVRVGAAGGPRKRGDRRVPASTPTGDFWFLEVNARLQVEHGVTELVGGLDIVHEQLFARRGPAAVGRGPWRRPIAPRRRTATRSRSGLGRGSGPGLRAGAGPGRRWAMPAGPGVRVDTAARPASACRRTTTR